MCVQVLLLISVRWPWSESSTWSPPPAHSLPGTTINMTLLTEEAHMKHCMERVYRANTHKQHSPFYQPTKFVELRSFLKWLLLLHAKRSARVNTLETKSQNQSELDEYVEGAGCRVRGGLSCSPHAGLLMKISQVPHYYCSCSNSLAIVGVLCISECVCDCRLIAQLHDELLYEVEDSQVEQFAGEFTTSNISFQRH